MNRRNKALLYLVITAVLWSLGGVLIKLVDWHPVAIAGGRSGIAALVMLLYLRKSPFRGLNKLRLYGAISYAALMILFVTANKLTTSANAILLQFTAPIWIALFSGWFLNEKISKADWIAVIAVFCGMIVFFIGDLNTGNMLGNFIAVLAGVAMAANVMLLKLQKDGSTVEMTLLGNVLTFIVAIPFFFTSVPSRLSILGILLLGVFQLGISYILYSLAVRYVSAIEAILIPILEPLLNPVWVYLGTGESPGKYAVVGGVIVVTAVVARQLSEQRRLQAVANQSSL